MKKVISACLALLMLCLCAVPSLAAAFPDTDNHWADASITYMTGKKILNGYEDGTFRPDRTVTRAEYIKMLDETFGLTATAGIAYTDVSASDWFYPYVRKAAAQGYLLNYGAQLNPNGSLSRQEAAALLVRYLALDASNKAPTTTYTDYSSISANYRDYVLMATAAKLFQGYEDNTFRPNNTLTRAEALTILYRAAGSIYAASATGLEAGASQGNAVVTKPDRREWADRSNRRPAAEAARLIISLILWGLRRLSVIRPPLRISRNSGPSRMAASSIHLFNSAVGEVDSSLPGKIALTKPWPS